MSLELRVLVRCQKDEYLMYASLRTEDISKLVVCRFSLWPIVKLDKPKRIRFCRRIVNEIRA